MWDQPPRVGTQGWALPSSRQVLIRAAGMRAGEGHTRGLGEEEELRAYSQERKNCLEIILIEIMKQQWWSQQEGV